jgi:ParB/RepB/Spo0J family partition protein
LSPELRSVPLDAILLSNTQAQIERRAHFDEAKLAELAESIKTVGLLSPLVCRPAEMDCYELVAGERRYLAAQRAGLVEVPVSVRELTDQQVLEVQLVENLQREDLHELAEAEGYEQLQQLGHSVEEIAAKVGKSKATVYARCKLLALVPVARDFFRRREVSASIALLVARIPADHQAETLSKIIRGWSQGPWTYRQAAEHIHREFNMRLADAEFPTEDPMLVQAAGSCLLCPKRSGNQPELFADIQGGDVCTDKACFDSKAAAWVQVKITAARRNGRAVEGEALAEIAPHGLDRGALKPGYIDLDWSCHEDRKSRTYRELLGEAAGDKTMVLVDAEAGEVAEVVRRKDVEKILKGAIEKRPTPKHDLTQRQPDPNEQRQQKLRQRLFRAIFDASPTNLREAANFAAADTMRALGQTMEVCEALGWDELNMDRTEAELAKMSNNDIARLLRVLPLCEELNGYGATSAVLLDEAKRLKVDVKKIEQQLDAELAPKASPPAAAKKKAAKKAPRKPK